jgi:hypothetical protein
MIAGVAWKSLVLVEELIDAVVRRRFLANIVEEL